MNAVHRGAFGANPETEMRILDAALAWTIENGLRKTSLDEIAGRAGVSRATLYVYFANRQALFDALLERELAICFEAISAAAARHTDPQERIVACVSTGLVQLAGHPALRSLREKNPKPILKFVLGEGALGIGIGNAFARDLLAVDLEPEVADLLADVVVRTFHSHLMAPSSTLDPNDYESCEKYARRVLLPVYRDLKAHAEHSGT